MLTIEKIVEICFVTALGINALLFIPQIIKILCVKEAKDLSLITFAGFNVVQIFAVAHGYLKQDNIILVGFGLSLITCGTITVLIIYYRVKNHKTTNQKY